MPLMSLHGPDGGYNRQLNAKTKNSTDILDLKMGSSLRRNVNSQIRKAGVHAGPGKAIGPSMFLCACGVSGIRNRGGR